MEKIDEKNAVIKLTDGVQSLDEMIIVGLDYLKLPTTDIFTDVSQRVVVYKNIEDVLNQLDMDKRINSFYISKFFAAVTSGLFDAALNYLWDETILQLRNRVLQYDLEYFYDCAVKTDKRSKLKSQDDLIKVDDSELLLGCKEIGLISQIGFNLLDNIKFMRNWASAAHPNNVKLSGLQLVTWLETCIREVICLPLTSVTIEINRLLENVKSKELTKEELENIVVFFLELTEEKVDALTKGFFGIYTRIDSSEISKGNINHLIPNLWQRVSEETRNSFGIKFAQFSANGESDKQKLARSFLESCNGEEYIPDNLRVAEINELLQSLRNVHNGMDNFYNEVIFAKQIRNLVKNKLPKQVVDSYVYTLVYVFLSNGYGIASSANLHYEEMIKELDPRSAMKAIITITKPDIAAKLNRRLCTSQYFKLIEMVDSKITSPMFRQIIEIIQKAPDLSKIITDEKVMKQIELVRHSMK